MPVLPLFGTPDSFFVVTERTWLGDLLAERGFALPAAGGDTGGRFPGFVPVSDEFLVTLRPELVLLVAHGDPRALREALERRTAEDGLRGAVGRSASLGVQVLPPGLFSSNPGLAWSAPCRRCRLHHERAGPGRALRTLWLRVRLALGTHSLPCSNRT